MNACKDGLGTKALNHRDVRCWAQVGNVNRILADEADVFLVVAAHAHLNGPSQPLSKVLGQGLKASVQLGRRKIRVDRQDIGSGVGGFRRGREQ